VTLESIAPKFFSIPVSGKSNLDAIAWAGDSNVGLLGFEGSIWWNIDFFPQSLDYITAFIESKSTTDSYLALNILALGFKS